MGKRASVRYIEEDVSLNDSVTEFAKEASLTDEQVKRVVEYANNATFASLFKNSYDKNITFPMADTNAVLGGVRETKEKVAEAIMTISKKYIPGEEYVELDKAFETSEGFVKAASVDRTSEYARDYLDLKQEFSETSREQTVLASDLLHKLATLHTLCKQASADGHSSSTVGSVILSAEPSDGLVSVITEYVGELADFSSKDKLAMLGYSVTPGNPMTGLTQDLEAISNKLVSTQQTITRTQMAMSELLGVLKGHEMGSPAARIFNPPGGTPMSPAPAPAEAGPGMGQIDPGMAQASPAPQPSIGQLFSPKQQ